MMVLFCYETTKSHAMCSNTSIHPYVRLSVYLNMRIFIHQTNTVNNNKQKQ